MKKFSTRSPAPNDTTLPPRSGSAENTLESPSQKSNADAFILTALSAKLRKWPDDPSAPDAQHLVERVDFHGVAGLLTSALEGVSDVPEDVATALRNRRLHHLFWEARHRFYIGQAIKALSEAGVSPVIIKGTASAYSVYETAADRVRGDTDILIKPSNRGHADEILIDLGFKRSISFARSRGASQLNYAREEGLGWSHDIDLHWQINNSPFLSKLFSWDELFSRSIPLSPLCDAARAPSQVDSLLITCFHRLVHLRSPYTVNGTQHYSSDRLIWLSDIDLLSKFLTEADWAVLIKRARQRGLARICLSGITAARAAFDTKLPQDVLLKLAESTDASMVETYLHGNSFTRYRLNFAAQSGIWDKVAYIGEHLFPPINYMRAQFGDGPLPALYFRRGVQGVRKLLSGKPNKS